MKQNEKPNLEAGMEEDDDYDDDDGTGEEEEEEITVPLTVSVSLLASYLGNRLHFGQLARDE